MSREPHQTGSRPWERWAPAGVLGFLLLLVVGAATVGTAGPSSQAPAETIAAYFADHRGGMLLNTSLAVFGGFALYPWFLAGLWRATRQVEGDDGILALVALVAGASLLGPMLLQAAGWGAAALEAGPRRDPAVAAALMDLGNMGFLLVPIPAAVQVAATSLATRSGELLPVWLVRAGLPLAVGGLLGFLPQLLFALLALWWIAGAAATGCTSGEPTAPRPAGTSRATGTACRTTCAIWWSSRSWG